MGSRRDVILLPARAIRLTHQSDWEWHTQGIVNHLQPASMRYDIVVHRGRSVPACSASEAQWNGMLPTIRWNAFSILSSGDKRIRRQHTKDRYCSFCTAQMVTRNKYITRAMSREWLFP